MDRACRLAYRDLRSSRCQDCPGRGQAGRIRSGRWRRRSAGRARRWCGDEMNPWARHPVIYEINTWAWLTDLGRKYQRPVHLGTVPEEEWEAMASGGFDAVWFMGVWERSPAGINISMRNQGLLGDFRRALSDFSPEDNVGSPYCVRRYVVDEHLGGPKGLAM